MCCCSDAAMAQKNDRDRRVLPPCPQAHRSIESKRVSGGRRRDCTALADPGAHCGHQACESQDANAGPRLAEIKAIAAAPSHQCPHQLTKFTALHWQHPFRRGHANRRKSQETRQAPQPGNYRGDTAGGEPLWRKPHKQRGRTKPWCNSRTSAKKGTLLRRALHQNYHEKRGGFVILELQMHQKEPEEQARGSERGDTATAT